MKARELKKLIKIKEPQEILKDYMRCEIYLTDKQLGKVIELKKGTPYENRGGTGFDYGKDKEN